MLDNHLQNIYKHRALALMRNLMHFNFMATKLILLRNEQVSKAFETVGKLFIIVLSNRENINILTHAS